MKIRDLIIVIVVLGFVGWKIFYHPAFPSIANDYLATYLVYGESNAPYIQDPCENRDHCVYLYLAPWCPHCRDFLPYITDFRNYWKSMDRPGLKVIVGNGKKDAINEMASHIGPPVYLDFHDKFLQAVHVNSFPYVVVVGADQRVIASGSEDGINWINKEINTHLKKQ
jgi:hypothetical protein